MQRRFGDSLFYYPTRHVYGRPESRGLAYESMYFKSADRTQLHGWFFPAGANARGTVIHCHGNAGNISGHFENVKWLPPAGWNVFCFDYRGYGQSAGTPTRAGTIEDATAAVHYVCSREDVDREAVVMLGQSLGGSVGIVVTAQCPEIRGIAVEGAFSGYRTEASFICRQNILLGMAAGVIARTLISDGFDPIDHVAGIAPRPTMFVCGTNDRIVDYRQTIALHDAAGEPKRLHVIEGGGHTDSMCEPQGCEWIQRFFEHCLRVNTHHAS